MRVTQALFLSLGVLAAICQASPDKESTSSRRASSTSYGTGGYHGGYYGGSSFPGYGSPLPPPPAPAGDLWQCQGVAYDGYLTSCSLWIDSDGDGQRGPGEPSASIVHGAFSFPPTPASRMGALFIEPADEDTRQVRRGSPICHDVSSRMSVRFPFAAPQPTSCSKPLVVTPLTSLLAYGRDAGLTAVALLQSLGLPAGYELETTDSLAAAAAGDGPSKLVYRREAQVVQLTMVVSRLLARHPLYLPATRKALLRALAAQIMGGHGGVGVGRRLLSAGHDAAVPARPASGAAVIDLTQAAVVQSIARAATVDVAALLPADQLHGISSDVLAAVAVAVADLNAVIGGSAGVDEVQKAVLVGTARLEPAVSNMASGALTVGSFQAVSSSPVLLKLVQQTALPGSRPPPLAGLGFYLYVSLAITVCAILCATLPLIGRSRCRRGLCCAE